MGKEISDSYNKLTSETPGNGKVSWNLNTWVGYQGMNLQKWWLGQIPSPLGHPDPIYISSGQVWQFKKWIAEMTPEISNITYECQLHFIVLIRIQLFL
jgi:hypothetical protein